MRRFNTAIVFLLFLLSLNTGAQEANDSETAAAEESNAEAVAAEATVAPAPPVQAVRQRPVRRAPRIRFGKSVGVGYIQWNEKMTLRQGSFSDTGMAAYNGPAANFDFNWNGSWWMLGMGSSVSAGKAASGGFKLLDFPDGINRSWYGFVLNPYALYRVTPRLLVGGGVISRFTWADWEPEDQSIGVDAQSGAQTAPSLQLRYRISTKLEFVNSFGFYGPTETQWILSANWNL